MILKLLQPAILNCTKSLHSSCISFQFVKDVYKVIQYDAPFSDEEKAQVCKKLNESSEKELNNFTSKKLSKAILDYRKKNDSFDRVERLLDIHNIEKFAVEKLCQSVLKKNSDSKCDNASDKSMEDKARKMFSKEIIPKPDLKAYARSLDNDHVIVGIQLTLQGLAFAKKGLSNELLEWAVMSLPTLKLGEGEKKKTIEPFSVPYFEHQNLYYACQQIVSEIPKADYYLLEEPLPFLQKDPYLKSKINLLKIRTMLIAILMHGGSAVHTIKPSASDFLFDLKRGTERISAEDSMNNEKIKTKFHLHIGEENSLVLQNTSNSGREYLRLSYFQTVAFDYLCKVALQDAKIKN